MANKTISILDFGTSKILALMAEEVAGQKLTITSVGMAKYDGFMNGGWNAPEKVQDAIAAAIEAMEEKISTQIRHTYVGVPGEFVRIYVVEASVPLQGADPKVTPEDVEKLQAQATEMLDKPSGAIIHRSPAWFRIDDGPKTLEPVDQKGSTLEGMISFVVADQFFISDVTDKLRRNHIAVDGFYSASVAEALQLISFEERDKTAILVDVGYLSTEVMAVEGDAVIWQKVIPFGGAHITLDLVYGLQKHFDICEKVKRSYSFTDTESRGIEGETEDGKVEQFDGSQVDMIVKARVDEILEMIEDAINKSGIRLDRESVYYFTGGGIMTMKDARFYVTDKLKHNVREGKAKIDKLKPTQIYASGSGLLELVFNMIDADEQPNGLLERIRRFFRKG